MKQPPREQKWRSTSSSSSDSSGPMPALILESNLATTRGQMIDLEERMGTQGGGAWISG